MACRHATSEERCRYVCHIVIRVYLRPADGHGQDHIRSDAGVERGSTLELFGVIRTFFIMLEEKMLPICF